MEEDMKKKKVVRKQKVVDIKKNVKVNKKPVKKAKVATGPSEKKQKAVAKVKPEVKTEAKPETKPVVVEEKAVEENEIKPEKLEKGKNEKKGKKEKKEKKEKGEKKSKKGLIILLVAILVLLGGGIGAKMILTKTSVTTETVKLPDDARGFSNYFKEYIISRVEAEILFSHSRESLGSEEVLNNLSALKDSFSKVSRGVTSNYGKSEYKELAKVMEADANAYLSMIRETRAIATTYSDENERKSAFDKKVEEMSEKLRSAVYVATGAFDADVSGLSSKGAFSFNGGVMMEAGGGVMNIFLGDFGAGVVAVSTDILNESVKAIEAEKLFGYTGSRVIKISDSLSSEIENGWFTSVKAEVGNLDVKMTTTKVSLVMKSLSGMDEELKSQGIKGLIQTEEKSEVEALNEALGGLKGKR